MKKLLAELDQQQEHGTHQAYIERRQQPPAVEDHPFQTLFEFF
jgi:hypothetical protein